MSQDKETQKKLITEIMEADAQDGLYEQQTAIQFLVDNIHYLYSTKWDEIIEEAKKMEKEQITKAWQDGDYAYFYSKKTGENFANGENYYNEIYGKSKL